MKELAEVMTDDYVDWDSFEKIPRVAAHHPDGVVELMPINNPSLYGFKYVNGHPNNPHLGLQTVTAFGVLADMPTGYPLLVTEMTLLTALRTATMTGLATKYLAKPNPASAALIGTGSQSEFHTIAHHVLNGITEFHVYDTDPAAVEKYVANMETYPGITIHTHSTTASAVAGRDVITTCTADKRNAIILTPDMITPGQHVNGIGGDCPGKTELDPTILDMGSVFVEYEPQTRIEGEIQNKPPTFEVTELHHVIKNPDTYTRNHDDITIYDSVGFAIEDYSALKYLHYDTSRNGIHSYVNLTTDPDDPKNLYALTRQPVGV